MTKFGHMTLLALAAASCMATGRASAQTIAYSSFSGHGQHNEIGPQTVGTAGNHLGYLPAGYIALAASFTPSVAGKLDHLDLALGVAGGYPGTVVTLVNDNGSGAPDLSNPVLETLVVQKLPTDAGTKTKNTLIRSAAKPSLAVGQTYWIVLTTVAYDGNLLWYQSNTVNQRVIYTANGGQSFSGYTSHQAGFDVWVNPGS